MTLKVSIFASNNFIRDDKMDFREMGKSLKSEFNSFFEKIINGDNHISKETFLEARNKINPKALIELNNAINEVIYEEPNRKNLWKKYRVLAFDENLIEIPNIESLRDEYGQDKSQNATSVVVKVCCIFNVVNNIILSSKIDKSDVSKEHMTIDMLSGILEKSYKNDLILFERNHYSKEIFSFLIENNIKFLMRISKTDLNKVTIENKKYPIFKIEHNKRIYKVRVIRFISSVSEGEFLITNLLDKNLGAQDFIELFLMRWGEEAVYNDLKDKIQVENFTGTTKKTIEQDFYAMIYLFNMIEMSGSQYNQIKDKLNINHKKKSNLKLPIGILKEKLLTILLENSETKRRIMFREMMLQIKREVHLAQEINNAFIEEEFNSYKVKV
ncbi:transposase IS4 family protein [Clostridium sp. DL-VIII]|uniref:transposase n=1 Tax=Clostridium sp. DL-VIII TaxID=641107 RepID=UPI00023AFE40|nr:transposase [Clostridium sp. DL-VIII]EHJ00279.1 transposase IS4 family protein [Clostridium sp. DL-VIII]